MKIGRKIKIPVLAFLVFACSSLSVSAESYIYDSENKAVESPDAYILSQELVLQAEGKGAAMPKDVFVSASGQVYVADTNNNRILLYNSKYELVRVLTEFTLANGTKTTLNKPEGIYVDEDETLYIADTENGRILEGDNQGTVWNVVENLKNFVGSDLGFRPSKIVVNKAGRIYAVAKNNNQGILQITKDSEFIGYIGAPDVQYSLLEMFWRKLSTETQLSKMAQFVPTEFNNIAMDDEEFIYATISALEAESVKSTISSKDLTGEVTPIMKLNVLGDDILKRNGMVAPMGDLEYLDKNYSKIVDVACAGNGIYAMLDSTNGRVFVYDYNGNLLCIFGQDVVTNVAAIAYLGEDVLVLDAMNSKLYVYKPTKYGQLLMNATSQQYNGNFEDASSVWTEVVAYNYNLEYAFIGLGQSYMEQGQYEEAMRCFMKASDKEHYSDAKELLRKENMKESFPLIVLGIIGVGVLVLVGNGVKAFRLYVKRLERREYQ